MKSVGQLFVYVEIGQDRQLLSCLWMYVAILGVISIYRPFSLKV